jgi:hypothetical protein
MYWTKSKLVSAVGLLLVAIPIYCLLVLTIYISAVVGIYKGVVLDFYPVLSAQRFLYSEIRNIWQYQTECIDLDLDLIYKPRVGACRHTNTEFDVTYNFTEQGRIVPGRKSIAIKSDAVAILGDSHAMGWGVEDEATFANILQRETNRPVYNFGVSSYGTKRELIRLINSPVYADISTIIVQYCDNDLDENRSSSAEFVRKSAMFKDLIAQQLIAPQDRHLPDHFARTIGVNQASLIAKAPLKPMYDWLSEMVGVNQSVYLESKPHIDEILNIINANEEMLGDRRIVVFYSNAHGKSFKQFGASSPSFPNVRFVDLFLQEKDYYVLDDHLNSEGHKFVGLRLASLLSE